MWFEVLPSFGVIVIAMGAPHAAAYIFNKVVNGNFFRREILTFEQRLRYLRDRRLNAAGDPYQVVGLEGLPDE